jgi:hypothetical protein
MLHSQLLSRIGAQLTKARANLCNLLLQKWDVCFPVSQRISLYFDAKHLCTPILQLALILQSFKSI